MNKWHTDAQQRLLFIQNPANISDCQFSNHKREYRGKYFSSHSHDDGVPIPELTEPDVQQVH